MSEAVVQHGAIAAPTGGRLMRRLNVGTAVAGGLIGGYVFWLVAHHFLQTDDPDSSNRVVLITMAGWALGFMAGIGAFHGPLTWLRGKDQSHEDETFLAGKDQGIGRYFRFTTDHKVVGIQYLVRHDGPARRRRHAGHDDPDRPDHPDSHFLSPQTYNSRRRPARPDHDHRHDHHGHRPVRELHRADHDRRPGHGVPPAQRPQPVADRGLRPGAVLGRLPRRHPHRLERATPRCRTRPLPAWTPT